MVHVHKGHKKKEGTDIGKLIHNHDEKLKGSSCYNFIKQTIFAIIVVILAVLVFNYLDRPVPEGITEVWRVRLLDAAHRTSRTMLSFLNLFGDHVGIRKLSRRINDLRVTTLITGSLLGLGSDPDLKIYDTEYDGVGVRVYEPVKVKGDKRPVLVYFHGGGWTWLSVDVYDPLTRALAKRSEVVVISVSYRLSPEYAHPIPFEDCLKVAKYVIQNAKGLGIDASRIAIGGDSAGGHLTAAVAMRLKKEIKMSIPIYPCLQVFDLQTPSYIENKGYMSGILDPTAMVHFWLNYGNISHNYAEEFLNNKHTSPTMKRSEFANYVSPVWYVNEYIRTPSLRNMKKETTFGNAEISSKVEKIILNPDYSPLMVPDSKYADLPLTYIVTAGYDILRDDGLIYYQRLKKAGVKVHLAHYNEGFHGMLNYFDESFQVGKRALDDLVNFLKKNL